jgi:hypothetical protein
MSNTVANKKPTAVPHPVWCPYITFGHPRHDINKINLYLFFKHNHDHKGTHTLSYLDEHFRESRVNLVQLCFTREENNFSW